MQNFHHILPIELFFFCIFVFVYSSFVCVTIVNREMKSVSATYLIYAKANGDIATNRLQWVGDSLRR